MLNITLGSLLYRGCVYKHKCHKEIHQIRNSYLQTIHISCFVLNRIRDIAQKVNLIAPNVWTLRKH